MMTRRRRPLSIVVLTWGIMSLPQQIDTIEHLWREA
jgi:hypothetical protein